MTASEKAKELINIEVFYWGQKGLETTQRCVHKAYQIRRELIRAKADTALLDFWYEVNKEIYKQGQ